jgi:hypothetical protein
MYLDIKLLWLCRSLGIFRIIKPRRLHRARNVIRMEETRNAYRMFVRIHLVHGYLKNQGRGGIRWNLGIHFVSLLDDWDWLSLAS